MTILKNNLKQLSLLSKTFSSYVALRICFLTHLVYVPLIYKYICAPLLTYDILTPQIFSLPCSQQMFCAPVYNRYFAPLFTTDILRPCLL
jgi:hypothetical protein